MSKTSHIHKALDTTTENAFEISGQISDTKFIILSDHHRGRRDGADDFLNNEATYQKALNYYLEQGYTLLLLGDVEEFWENPFEIVIKNYKDVLEMEKQFYDQNRLLRIWGNHDDIWQVKSYINKYLGGILPGLDVYEAVKLNLFDGEKALGKILFVHGHQGTAASSRFASISRFFVRYVWRYIQKWFNIPLSTPANNIRLKSEHDMIMFDWANKRCEEILICGHTHQPVFMSFTHADILNKNLEVVETSLGMATTEVEIATLKTHKETILKDLARIKKEHDATTLEVTNHRKPCYFNSGCCSFSNGDITGIEIEGGEIRLIKWTMRREQHRKILEKNNLKSVLAACE